MQQPTLAPAPHAHQSLQDASVTEQKLRAQLMPHIASPQTTTPGTPGAAGGSASPQELNPNIDPAISGVGATAASQPQQPQQQPQQPQQQPPPQQPQQPPQQQQQPQRTPPQRQHQKVVQSAQQQPVQQSVPAQHVQAAVPQPMTPQTPGVQNIQMAGSPIMTQGVSSDQQQHSQSQSGAEESEQPKPRGGKRELSTSKRAAQNRAAQRAFRQRKEGYIKKLEEQVREFSAMQENFKQIQAENFALREYIITIQARIIATQGPDAVPPAPVAVQSALAVEEAPQLGAPVQGSVQPNQASQSPSIPIQQHPIAPTAVMQQPQAVLQEVAGVPLTPQLNNLSATAGQKRPHDDTDNTFLQSIAQAAGTTGNGLVAASQSAAAAAAQAGAKKSASPASKRVKGEKIETKPEGEHINGV